VLRLPRANLMVNAESQKLHAITVEHFLYVSCSIVLPDDDILNDDLHILLECNIICQQICNKLVVSTVRAASP